VSKNSPITTPSLHPDLSREIIACAFTVHTTLGPGFLESIYEEALKVELRSRHIPHKEQVSIPVEYRSIPVGAHRLDLVVDGKIIVELKATGGMHDIYLATMLSYLNASKLNVGLILNFGGSKAVVRRVVRNF
jgi:GxxExxY protein